jgi:hypothetical protein
LIVLAFAGDSTITSDLPMLSLSLLEKPTYISPELARVKEKAV